MKLKYITIYISFTAIFVFALMAFSPSKKVEIRPVGNKNIIKFSHVLHKDLAECSTCHTEAAQSTSLNNRLMPNHENCKSCHDVEKQEDCSKCHINDNYEALKQDKTELVFNHKFHLEKQGVKCETCHKGVSDVEYAEDAAQPFPKMEDCYSCHNQSKIATNACEACHTNTAGLLPQSHKNSNFQKSHKFAAEDINANCIMCHDNGNNSCENCHNADKVSSVIGNNNFAKIYAPGNFKNGARQQSLVRVHDLNYKFNHGIDFQSHRLDCQSCHEVATFCVTCHKNENSRGVGGGIVPASHLQQNFFTYGVGTGGGLHAQLARRDIESCQSCHDVQGADPTCITCHLDNDGIKGTNPKTHPSGFMKDIHGDWHTSQGSVCYNCHSGSPNGIASQGFCGYCHGSQR